MPKIPPFISLDDTGHLSRFRGILFTIKNYALTIDKIFEDKYKTYIEEANRIEEEFENIVVDDYDKFHLKDPDTDTDYDFNTAYYKEELEDEITSLRCQAEDYVEHYRQIAYESLFLTIYSYFEIYLKYLCDAIRKKESLSLKLNDLSGRGVERSATYLKKVVRLNLSGVNKEWEIIKLLNSIRNTIVHDPEKIINKEKIDRKLHSYFWLKEPELDIFFEENDIAYNSEIEMFSAKSIEKIVDLYSDYTSHIDEAYKSRQKIRIVKD